MQLSMKNGLYQKLFDTVIAKKKKIRLRILNFNFNFLSLLQNYAFAPYPSYLPMFCRLLFLLQTS